jgi:ferredoxin
MVCGAGLTLCGRTCIDTRSDAMNCGGCMRACPSGSTCQMGACTPAVMMTGTPFQIESLTSSNCRATEHNGVTGDDRGGIAVGSGRVYYTGDERTAAFDLESLAPAAQGARRLDGIFGVSALNLALTLGSNRAPLDERTSIIDSLLAVGPDANLSARLIALSSTIFINRMTTSSGVGIFGGVDRVIVTEGARAWIIDGLMARVTQLAIAPIGDHQGCESWAFWGVAEFFEGAPWVAYVRDSRTVARQNLVTGEVRVVASFDNLSDMCSFTVLPSRNRWYFHHEGESQFRTGDETLGYCDARFSMAP